MININKIFFKTTTFEPGTKLPVFVFDTTALPSPATCDFPQLIDILVSRIPDYSYALVFLTAGLSSDKSDQQIKFSWTWGVKAFTLIPKPKRRLLRKLYVVHELWWIRALTEVLRNIVSSKFLSPNKLVHVASLSELLRHVDISHINISLPNYVYEKTKLALDSEYDSLRIVVPIHSPDIFGAPLSGNAHYPYTLLFVKICQVYYSSPVALPLFSNPSSTAVFRSSVLADAFQRNQLITLDEFDLVSLVTTWKRFLRLLPLENALIPLDIVVLSYSGASSLNTVLSKIQLKRALNSIMNILLAPMILHDLNHLYKSSARGSADENVSKYLNKLAKQLSLFLFGLVSDAPEADRKIGLLFLEDMLEQWPYLKVNELRVQKVSPQPPLSRKPPDLVLHVLPNGHIAKSTVARVYFTFFSGILAKNKAFLTNKSAIIKVLREQDNQNNFNIVPKDDPEAQSSRGQHEVELEVAKENVGKSDLGAKIKASFKQYFKPLSESNINLPKLFSALSLGVKSMDMTLGQDRSPKRSGLPKRGCDTESKGVPPRLPPRGNNIPSLAPPPPPPRNLSPKRSVTAQSSVESLESLETKRSMVSLECEVCSTSLDTVSKKLSVLFGRELREQEFISQNRKKYAGIENGRVVKLAQLFEERVEGVAMLAVYANEEN